MKKFLSIVAVLAIVFALAVPSFAATSAPSVSAGDEITGSVVGGDLAPGTELVVSDTEMTSEEEAALADAVKEAAPGAVVGDVVDVELKDADGNSVSEDYFKDHKTLTVAFAYDNAKDVVAVLYWNAKDGKWDEAHFEIKDGKLYVDFEHLCTVAFMLKDVESNPNVPDQPNKPNSTGKKDPSKSQQTGYNTALWVAAAVVLILGAGYCFVSARKKAAE